MFVNLGVLSLCILMLRVKLDSMFKVREADASSNVSYITSSNTLPRLRNLIKVNMYLKRCGCLNKVILGHRLFKDVPCEPPYTASEYQLSLGAG